MARYNKHRPGWITLLLGSPSEPFRQIHNAFLLVAALVFGVAAAINQLFALTPWHFNLLMLGLIPAVLGLWAWSRFGAGFRPAGIAFATLLALVVLPVAWFANGGINGPTLLFYLSVMLYVAGMLQGRRLLAALTLSMIGLSPIVLVIIQYHFPMLVHTYPNPRARMLDIAVSYALVVVMIGVLLLGHFRRFNDELRLSHSYADRLRHLADHDGMTGLLNHRAILEIAHRSHEQGQLAALIFCDLDHFKQLNDRFGHPYGDSVLRAFARMLHTAAAKFSIHCARYGGEEFLVVVTDPRLEIQWIDDYLRQQASIMALPHGPVTFSSGGTVVATQEALTGALQRADQALYRAKGSGRNRLVIKEKPTTGFSQPQNDLTPEMLPD